MALALDGSGQTEQGASASSFTIALTTVNANDVIIVACQGNSSASTGYSISGPGLSSFTLYNQTVVATNRFSILWGTASAAFSGNITVTVTGYGGFGIFGGIAWGISGANTSSPFDPGSGSTFPVISTTTTPASGTTSNANDFVMGISLAATGLTNGSGWTQIGTAASTIVAEYQVASSTGTFTANISNNSASVASVLTAVVQASAAPGPDMGGSAAIYRVQRPGWRWRAPPKGYIRRNGILLKAA